MSDNSAFLVCSKCNTRLSMKPGLLKVLKTIRCSKCGHGINVAEAFAANLVEMPLAEKSSAPVESVASAKPPASPASPPTAVAAVPDAKAAEDVSSLREKLLTAERDIVQLQDKLSRAERETSELKSMLEAVNRETDELAAARREIDELNDRVTSLQQLWHSKELESRDIAKRAKDAEKLAEDALAIRNTFLESARRELAIYLVGERDAALSRFSALEKKLLEIKPEG